MSTYKLLILDYGGVYSFEYTAANFNKIILEAFGKIPTAEQRQKIVEYSHILGENKLTTSEYVILLAKLLETSQVPTPRKFEDITISVTNPPTLEMKELVAKVRSSGIKVSLLSDMYMFEIQRTRPIGRYDGFDYISLSAEAGMTKHNPSFFKQTLNHFGIDAEDALFVDDIKANIDVAISAGLGTLYADKTIFANVEQLSQEIYQLLGIG